jgi:MYXO-CTERM domain-containing protein
MTILRSRLLAGASFGAAMTLCSVAVAAQTDIAISMTGPGATPQIFGPTVLGSTPNTPFLYTVPATGQAPLTFSATGLPAGLSLASGSGTISGTTPGAGSYPVTVTVRNGTGSATATLTLDSGATLALTPPLGWNSYDSFGSSVTESDVLAAAQAMKTQLQPFGWNTIVVDFLWFDPEDVLDANGRYLPSPSKFPSATGALGFKPLADEIHAMGLSFGIHIMRGIPRTAVTANSPIAGSTFTASNAANTSDASPWDSHMWGVFGSTGAGQAWYDSIFAQYAQWGIDFVKVDDMINNQVTPLVYHQAEADAIRASIGKTGRSIVFSLSPGPMQTTDLADLNADANMWRMVNDFWDVDGLSTLADVFTAAGNWQGTSGLLTGHWPDADMLPLGFLGPRCPVHASGPTALNHNQQVSVMSLWGILPSPLVFGGNVPDLATDATGPWTVALLTNGEVLAVNQDAAGTHATRISQAGTTEVWARDLSGGRKAVALFNNGTQDAVVSVTFAQLGVSGVPAVRDLWHRADVTGMTSGLSVTVPFDGALMYVLSPTAGDGGTDGGPVMDAGSVANEAGAARDGGADGGASDATVSVSQEGGVGPDATVAVDGSVTAGSEAGSGSTEAGMNAGEGGGAAVSDAAAPSNDGDIPGKSAGSASGCGCTLVGDSRAPRESFALAGFLGLALVARRRRRRSGRGR